MSIQLQNRLSALEERLTNMEEILREVLASVPKNGSDSQLEIRIQTLENKYMAMNARMGKRDG